MKKICFTLIVTFLLFACATPAKYDDKLNGFLGHNEAYLIKKMGKPSATKIISDQLTVVSYVKANNTYVPSEFYIYGAQDNSTNNFYNPFLNDYDFTPYSAAFGYQVEYYCQTVFLLENGIITGWKWKGNDCTAY